MWIFFLMCCLPDALLGPFKIPLGLSGGLESFVKVCSQTLHAALCHGLQLKKLLLLSAHLTGANFCGPLASNLISSLTQGVKMVVLGSSLSRLRRRVAGFCGVELSSLIEILLTSALGLPGSCQAVLGRRHFACDRSGRRQHPHRSTRLSSNHNLRQQS